MTLVRFLRANPVATSLLLIAAVSAVFLVFPGIDLWFSELFYRSKGGFWLRRSDALALFRRTSDVVIAVIVVGLLASVAVKLARPGRPGPLPPNAIVFLLATLLLGPLLLVNVILKNTWGRPRPVEIEAFGGEAPYVEVWRITGWCADNCSFVSGEASSAIWLVAVALVLPPGIRPAATVVAVVYALLLSLNRIAFGGHFLSDVLIAFGLTLLLVAVVHRVVIELPPAWLSNAALEARLTRLGRAMRGKPGQAGTA